MAESTLKAHCNKCLIFTNHKICYQESTNWEDVLDDESGISISGGDTWILVRCLGCDSVRLKRETWFSEDVDERGRLNIAIEWFPPSIKRQMPIWHRDMRVLFLGELGQYRNLTKEIYQALAIGAHRIAAMGVRALVERLMVDRVGDKGTFEQNIAAFFADGNVSLNQQGLFRDTLIEAGHAAMHRNFEPDANTINTLLDIVEGIMHSMFYAPLIAERAKKTIPKRVPKKD